MGNSNRFYIDIMALHDEVTGSCILCIIQFPDGTTKRLVVDCGLFQELEYSELNKNLPFEPANIDYVVVTHNHVDHTGRLPFLVQNGYRGDIHMSHTTAKLLPNALYDSYKVLKNKAKMANEPQLYSDADVDETLKLVKPHNYEETFHLTDKSEKNKDIKLTFFMNGHLPGAVVVLMQVKYRDDSGKHYEDINMLFTGDYNNKNMFFDVKPIPKWVHQLPITIIQEATYGTMDSTDIVPVFENNILTAIKQGKEVVIPVFSLGRAQEIMYILKNWQMQGKLSTDIPIYLDGKLAWSYTNLYLHDGLDNKEECSNFLPENFTYVSSDSETRSSIMSDGKCKIMLVTSGMGSHGPAQTYLPVYLSRPNALIHFTGYCAEGTLGRRLYECEKGEKVEFSGLIVRRLADVQFTSEHSAHAKADELLGFLAPFECIRFFLSNHGSFDSKEVYTNRVIDEIEPKGAGILGRDYFFRIDGYGLIKTISTKFR